MLEVEAKWNKKWEEEKTYKFDPSRIDKKYYVLEMFSYPSGAKLHVGHWFNYGPSDSFARFKRMQGYEVFQPMGFDAFGLPAENYAIKTGIHPKDSTMKNIATMEKQLKNIGATSIGITRSSRVIRSIINGRNGCFCKCINTIWRTERKRRSTGARPARPFLRTSRSSTAAAKDAARRLSVKI